MRNKKKLKITTNNTVYKRLLSDNFGCSHCPPSKGCNKFKNNDYNSWKSQRRYKWRNN